MKEDRRMEDQVAHKEILDKLNQLNDGQIVIKTTQLNVLDRLAKINGTVADYNANKFKIEESHKRVQDIEDEAKKVAKELLVAKDLEHARVHIDLCEKLDNKYISKVGMITLGAILGLLLTINTALNLFGIRIGG